MHNVYRLYLSLLKTYGQPPPWPWKKGVKPSTPFEICLGAILTQNTNWRSVEKALDNLKRARVQDVKTIATTSNRELETCLKPSGFYRQKTERVKNFCQYLLSNYQGSLRELFEKELQVLRLELLSLKGIGPETADTILLYAGKKPIFVIDEYTRRFSKKHDLSSDFSYSGLQSFFMNNLPRNVKIYKDYHALIVKDGVRQRVVKNG